MKSKKRKKKDKLIFQVGRPIGILVLAGSFSLHAWKEAQVGFPQKHLHPEFYGTCAQDMMRTSITTSAATTTSIMTSAGMKTMNYLKF